MTNPCQRRRGNRRRETLVQQREIEGGSVPGRSRRFLLPAAEELGEGESSARAAARRRLPCAVGRRRRRK